MVHENRGLNPHIEDIARRLALDNFIALTPDALFTLGGYPGDEDKARELFPKLDQQKTRNDFIARRASPSRSEGRQRGKVGVGRVLLRRRHRELPRHSRSGSWRRSAVLRRAATAEDAAKIKAPPADPLRRVRRSHQRGLAGLREPR